MKKLEGAQSYVYCIMDILGPIREAMAQKDDDWEKWGLEELVENLRSTQTETPCPWWNLACPLQAPLYLGIETITKTNQTKTLWLEVI